MYTGVKAETWSTKMEPETATIKVGETIEVKAIETGDLRVMTWPIYKSSDTSIATVDDRTGIVTGISPGTVTITGSYGNLIAGTTTLIVENNNETNYIVIISLIIVLLAVGSTTFYIIKKKKNS